jgi:hypothetical protein
LNPKEEAKVAGSPWSVMVTAGARAGRRLRERRGFQDRRQCARSARVKTASEDRAMGECVGGEGHCVTSTVSLRMRASHVRRMLQRGQSRQSPGAAGSNAGAVKGARRGVRGRRGTWPEHRTHPSRFESGGAFLTLRTQGAGSTISNARGIPNPQRAIALGAPGLRIQGMESRGNAAFHQVAG